MPQQLDTDRDEFSNDGIKKLLQSAEQRLKQATSLEPSPRPIKPASFSANSQAASAYKLRRLNTGHLIQPYITSANGRARADPSRLISQEDRKLSEQVKKVEDPLKLKEKTTVKKTDNTGPDWFHLPRTDLTSELKQDLQIIKMRSILDPKRHYKTDSANLQTPGFSQIGTIIEGPTEFYSSRILNNDRRKTIVDEVLAMEKSTGRFRSKYRDVQLAATSGKKTFYKNLKARRSRGVRKR
ncbi:hypothetical protein MMC22_005143 [Lobaria immixta]|nr:hypothetical protein [Lobaria immixta]